MKKMPHPNTKSKSLCKPKSLKFKRKNQNKTKQKMLNHKIVKQASKMPTLSTTDFIWHWLSRIEHGVCPNVCFENPLMLIREELNFFLCKLLAVGDSFWVMDRGLCPLLPALGPHVPLTCACGQSLRVHVCVSLLCGSSLFVVVAVVIYLLIIYSLYIPIAVLHGTPHRGPFPFFLIGWSPIPSSHLHTLAHQVSAGLGTSTSTEAKQRLLLGELKGNSFKDTSCSNCWRTNMKSELHIYIFIWQKPGELAFCFYIQITYTFQ